MTIRNSFPDVRPALNLDFANTKRLDPRITFTRSSTGTYVDEFGVIKTAASNEARFDHDGDGNSLGLLIEESRTNRMLYSEDFTQTYYNKSFCTVGTTSVIAPDGVSTANALVEDASNDEHYVNNTGGFPYGQFTTSVFVKAGTRSFCYLNFTNSGTNSARSAYFNLTTGEFQIVAAPTPSVVIDNLFAEQHPNGWWRISATVTSGRGTQFILGPATALTPPVAVGARETYQGVNGDEALYMWGAQSENSQDNGDGLSATSYIPTSGSTATRSADVASMTGTNFSSWYNQSEGTVFADITDLGYPLNTFGSLWKIFASTSHTSGRNSINVTRYSGGALPEARFGVYDQNAVKQVDLITTSPPTSARVKSAIGLQSGSYAASSHGNTVVTSSAAVPPTFVAADTLAFGQATNLTTQQKSCLVARLTYYDRRLTDAQLQALTL